MNDKRAKLVDNMSVNSNYSDGFGRLPDEILINLILEKFVKYKGTFLTYFQSN
jgi:hypothetical protein